MPSDLDASMMYSTLEGPPKNVAGAVAVVGDTGRRVCVRSELKLVKVGIRAHLKEITISVFDGGQMI